MTELWPGILDQMRQTGAGMLSAVVGIARPVAVDVAAGTLTIAFPPGSAFNLRKADDKDNRELVAAAILAVLGEPLRPEYTMLDSDPGPSSPPAAATASRRAVRTTSSSASSPSSTPRS